MSYPVHLEMTHDMAEWLASVLEYHADSGDQDYLDLADSVLTVSDGRYDIASPHPEHYQVTAP